ncbi:hypothetical protein [Clostridium sp. ATCC 25772]|uniref:hypothetical protein n=1 Tax=Clostridium sp. ATCC 25772 TaxID=1676991 RepID=UPI0007823C7B|nr:hypothetical protein [Clostridium sp. ATCC 25772]
MIKTVNDFSEILDFAWSLCQDNKKNSYPRRKSKEDLQSGIEKAINSDTRKIIACYKENMLMGVCSFFWIEEEMYIQTNMFLIKDNYNITADEIINYLKNKFKGYNLLIGITFDNKDAIKYLESRNFKCIESSIDTRLYKENYKVRNIEKTINLLQSNQFEEYAKFHDKYAKDMYWNSEHIKESFDDFNIFVYMENGTIMGSIFVRDLKIEAEVIGLFIDERVKGKGIESNLINVMIKNIYKKYTDINDIVYFIDEDSEIELDSAKELGFKIIDKYRCYECKL